MLLRLEDLFDRFSFFAQQADARHHHVALLTLFELAEIAQRTDLRNELLKEIDRQRQTLAALRGNPQIDPKALEAILAELDAGHQNLLNLQGKTGQHLAENEWLASIRSRAVVPGGTSRFDLPSYYAWQQAPLARRQQDIGKWFAPFLPLHDAMRLILRLLRESGQSSKRVAAGGTFQQPLAGRTFLLLRVAVEDAAMIPEISANKHLLMIRFTAQQDGELRPKAVDADVAFRLTFCNF